MTLAVPKPDKPKQKFKIPWALVILALFGAFIAYKNYTRPMVPVAS
jgi:hypothetical protein